MPNESPPPRRAPAVVAAKAARQPRTRVVAYDARDRVQQLRAWAQLNGRQVLTLDITVIAYPPDYQPPPGQTPLDQHRAAAGLPPRPLGDLPGPSP